MLGVIFIQGRQLDRAVRLLSKALKQNSRSAAAHSNMGLALKLRGQLGEAKMSYERAIALQTHDAAARLQLAAILTEMKRPAEALTLCDQSIAVRPQDPFFYLAKAVALRAMQHPEEALASCDAAVTAQPGCAEAWDKRGAALQDLGRLPEALLSCEKAIEVRGNYAPAYAHAGLICLQMGQFERGWHLSEWRDQPEGSILADSLQIARWRGEDNLNGRTIWTVSEQGLGDTLQFCRYAQLLASRGARVTLAVQPSLRALMRSLGSEIEIASDSDRPKDIDQHCPLMSLPGAFNTTGETIPATVPYLCADPARVQRWRERLGSAGVKIGICWQGSTLPSAVGKSFPLGMLLPISQLDSVRLISLQKGSGTEQLTALPPGMRVETLGSHFDAGPDAFLDTAAVMANLELIITCDTSIAHLAGALGRPTWIALKRHADWRWMLDREDSPWYPTVRLFRQESAGEWNIVFDRMLHAFPRFFEALERSTGENRC